MYLVLTRQDLARLSPELRAELKMLAFEKFEGGNEERVSEEMGMAVSHDPGIDWDYAPPWPEPSEKSGDNKRVIDIATDEAVALLGNLSAKSVETLKRFASGEGIPFDSLVGPENSYKDLSDLKRSFVGAVNRRLRTVTGNRSAVLFRKIEGDDGVSIAVRPVTAASLTQVFESEREKKQ